MPNVKTAINRIKKMLLTPPPANTSLECNCVNKETFPLSQNYLAKSLIEATISYDIPNYMEKKYIGLCESTFKKRFENQKSSFNHEQYKNSTSLFVELWKVNEANGTPSV